MKVIARPIGTNKTKELLELANKNDGLILTTTKRALKVKADAYGFTNLTIVDPVDLVEQNYPEDKPLYIHKAADVLKEFFKTYFDLELEGFSITMEE